MTSMTADLPKWQALGRPTTLESFGIAVAPGPSGEIPTEEKKLCKCEEP
jgi:hypothetical protein